MRAEEIVEFILSILTCKASMPIVRKGAAS
jgi:hypothetical protein